MKQIFRLVVIALLFSINSYGQQVSEQVINAFASSYASESSKDYTRAINDLRGIYSENFYEVNIRMGWLNYLKKDYNQSVKYYRQAIKIRPTSIEAMFGLVSPAAALENWTEVFATYQKILSIDGNNSLANYRIALMYYYRKEFGSAEKHLQNVISHYPFDFDSVLLMAQVKLAMGKLAESKAFYQRALLYNPSNEAIKAMLSKL